MTPYFENRGVMREMRPQPGRRASWWKRAAAWLRRRGKWRGLEPVEPSPLLEEWGSEADAMHIPPPARLLR